MEKHKRCKRKSTLHLENGGIGQADTCSCAGYFFQTAEKTLCVSLFFRFMSEWT